MKKVACMMVLSLLCAGTTVTMAQQDTTRRNSQTKQGTQVDTSRRDTSRNNSGTMKRDTTRRNKK